MAVHAAATTTHHGFELAVAVIHLTGFTLTILTACRYRAITIRSNATITASRFHRGRQGIWFWVADW